MGGVYLNFGLWGISLLPAWFVVRQIGYTLGDRKVHRETNLVVQEKVPVTEEKSASVSEE